jgi:hypothetical protein
MRYMQERGGDSCGGGAGADGAGGGGRDGETGAGDARGTSKVLISLLNLLAVLVQNVHILTLLLRLGSTSAT